MQCGCGSLVPYSVSEVVASGVSDLEGAVFVLVQVLLGQALPRASCTTKVGMHERTVELSSQSVAVFRLSRVSWPAPVFPCVPGTQTVTNLVFFCDGLKNCGHKVISAKCPDCQSDVNSNKRGCGSQASAMVDVPTDSFFLLQCGPRSPTRVQACVRMLGNVYGGQPTVILRG